MAPQYISPVQALDRRMVVVTKPTDPDGLLLEAWAQGYMVGSIIIMVAITVSNFRRRVLLHKLILLEVFINFHFNRLASNPSQLILGTFHGTFIFSKAPVYGWYISVTAIFLILSWTLHVGPQFPISDFPRRFGDMSHSFPTPSRTSNC